MVPKANSYSARLIEIVQSSAVVSVELDKLYKSEKIWGQEEKINNLKSSYNQYNILLQLQYLAKSI